MPMPTSRMRRSANAALAAVLSAVACRPWALVLARLPGTSSPQEVAQVLKRDGVVVLEQRSSKETVAAALEELSTGRMSGGRNVRFGDSTQLLKWPLDPAKEPALMSLAEDPLVLQASELARQEHGEGSHHGIAWEVRLLILPPGMPEGDMHRDVVDTSKIPLQRPLQWGLNTIWATDAFTLENGATRFVPGSHSGSFEQGTWQGDHPEAAKVAQAARMDPGSAGGPCLGFVENAAGHVRGVHVSVVRLSGEALVECVLETADTLQPVFGQVPHAEGAFLLASRDKLVTPSTLVRELEVFESGQVLLTVIAHPVQAVASTRTAFAVVTASGAVCAWGDSDMGGQLTPTAQRELQSNVRRVYSNAFAFAALKGDGSVVTWGLPTGGGDSRAVRSQLRGVQEIFATRLAFAALKADGSVVAWGAASYGGEAPTRFTSPVCTVRATDCAFAALSADGSVTAWGDSSGGGDAKEVADELARGDVAEIFACKYAFAAITRSGSLLCWGSAISTATFDLIGKLDVRVRRVFCTSSAFAALTTEGKVLCWGDGASGGDASHVEDSLRDVVEVYGNEVSFAAVRRDGSVVTWGGHYLDLDNTALRNQLSQVRHVWSTCLAFAALRADGSVVTWGHRNRGGDSSCVAHNLRRIRAIRATDNAFAAISDEGAVVTWGVQDAGGNSSAVEGFLCGDVHEVHSTCNAFLAVKYDGSIVTWGGRKCGGDATPVAQQLQVRVSS
ncbi:unnamed protein product [Effrenium voratum]|nr:unnamed protein product [Effrenium voratum]